MAIASATTEQRFVFYNVSWQEYEALLKLWARRHLRMAYDRGTLEIMSPSYEHGRYQSVFDRLIKTLSFELGLPLCGGSDTTFRRQLEERGLEPDECYWIRNMHRVSGKLELDLATDPPPDLALEIEVTSGALDKLAIYAGLGFPEVWRFDGVTLYVHLLQPDGQYAPGAASLNFPTLPLDEMARWVLHGATRDENALVRDFVAWIRAGMPRVAAP